MIVLIKILNSTAVILPARVETLVPPSNSYSCCDKIFLVISCLNNEFRVMSSSMENLSSGFGIFMRKPSETESNFVNFKMWMVHVVKSL